jgi:short-subunit dehydrogenase
MGTTWKRALVTGASSGIGEAMARRLAISGTHLVLVARDQVKLDKLADELDDYHGVDIEILPADLSDPIQLAVVERRLAAATDPVDLLVNNAGFGFHGAFAEVPVGNLEAEIQVNVVAVLRLAHAAARAWRDRPSGGDGPVGGILNVSSTASFQPLPFMANYAGTKAWVTSFSQALHEELKADGIVVTCVCPGITRTAFPAKAGLVRAVPSVLSQSAEDVAAAGLAAVGHGRAVVVSGVLNKAAQVTGRLVPLSALRWGTGRAGGRRALRSGDGS